MPNAIWDYVVLGAYLLMIIGFAVYFHHKKSTASEYIMGGRRLPFFAVGLSCMMALLSSISIVQVPGEIYNHGFTFFILQIPGLILAIPAYLLFTRFYFKLGSYTPYEYLEYRYDPSIRALVAMANFYTRILYLGLVLFTTAKIFHGSYGWPVWLVILVVGAVGIAYAFVGGMRGVVWIDVAQFFILFGSLIALFAVLIYNIKGGLTEAIACASREGHIAPQVFEKEFYTISPYVRLCFFLMLWGRIFAILSHSCSDQITVQRLLSTGNWKAGFKSQIISSLTSTGAMTMLFLLGFCIFTYYHQNPDFAAQMVSEMHDGQRAGDNALFYFIAHKLPSPLPGLFLAGLFAAILSTIDGGYNSMATLYLKEFHQKFINKNMTSDDELRVSKKATFWLGLFSIVLAIALDAAGRWLSQTVSEVDTIFKGLVSATLPAFLFAVLSKRANAKLIWSYTFFALGELAGKNTWYIMSKSAVNHWNEAMSNGILDYPLGAGGPLAWYWLVLPVVVGVLLLLPVLLNRGMVKNKLGKTLVFAGLFSLGVALSFLWWYLFSNACIGDTPKARSFAFQIPASFILCCIALRFFPEQERRKYMGLTIFTVNEKVEQ